MAAEPHRGHRGTAAVSRLVELAPATGALALWVRHVDLAQARPDAPPLATDGRAMFYAPAFEALTLTQQIGWVAHELLHLALRHVPRRRALAAVLGDVDAELYNLCADAIVHSTLDHVPWLALPDGAVTLPRLLGVVLDEQATPEQALARWDVERLYRAVDDRRPGRNGREDGHRAARARGMAARQSPDLLPEPTPGADGRGADDTPEDEAALAREWQQRLLRAQAADGEFSIWRTLGADLPRPRTPWEQVLRGWVARTLAPRPSVSWSRPSRACLALQGRAGPHRRAPFEPGRSAFSVVPTLAVVVDVSGSIDEALLARFGHELATLSRRGDAAVVRIVGDDRVREVRRFAPGAATLEAWTGDGGGGTDFAPLLAEAARHRPDLTLVLTDLDGPAGPRPPMPVVWAVPDSAPSRPVPFGRLLRLA